jgi:hypothetical protein
MSGCDHTMDLSAASEAGKHLNSTKDGACDTIRGVITMSDQIQFVQPTKSPDTAMSHDPLFKQWVSMHEKSYRRDTKDNGDCLDAKNQDKTAVDARTAHQWKGAQKRADDRQDLKGDRQAIGDKHHAGADQMNASADSKIVKLDRALLKKYGAKLTPEQKQTLEEDIAAKTKTGANSKDDVPRERQYITGDQREINALKHGSKAQIEQANQNQIQMRQRDMGLEGTYIKDNDRSKEADKKVLGMFGGIKIVDGSTTPHGK